ncbi:MAG: monooxygenase [Minicystis sp.]
MKIAQRVGSIVTLVSAVLAVACSSGTAPGSSSTGAGTSSGDPPGNGLAYYRDIKPIFDAKCASCHYEGGIGPFAVTSYADFQPYLALIKQKVTSKEMPPWLADDSCTDYVADRSLDDAQIKTIGDWVDGGGLEGDAKDEGKPVDVGPTYALSRVDLSLSLPTDYLQVKEPDDYRCFVIDWPKSDVTYVTGFRANPGNAKVVHHVIAFLAPPSQVDTVKKLDDAEPGEGYTCFGGPGFNQTNWIGAWAPGSLGTDYPVGTGIKVEPGSKVVLQVHYNTLTAGKQKDRTSIDFKLDPTVTKEATIQPWTNPTWLSNKPTMKIPAFEADTMHSFAFDPTPFLSKGKPFLMYSANLHMHQLGTHAKLTIQRKEGDEDCLLDIPKWNFHWQGSYGFPTPKVFHPGDKVYLECHWDNTPPMQPIVDGKAQMPKDVFWGESTTDEMCLGGFYMVVP